jgi:membrane-bound lytic murein transglycosylase MltF
MTVKQLGMLLDVLDFSADQFGDLLAKGAPGELGYEYELKITQIHRLSVALRRDIKIKEKRNMDQLVKQLTKKEIKNG